MGGPPKQRPASAGSNNDPFTGNSSYTTMKQDASGGFFPVKSYHSFDVGDAGVILKKLKEFNEKCGDGNDKLSDNDLEDFVKLCAGPPSDGNAVDVLFKLLEWPDSKWEVFLIPRFVFFNFP